MFDREIIGGWAGDAVAGSGLESGGDAGRSRIEPSGRLGWRGSERTLEFLRGGRHRRAVTGCPRGGILAGSTRMVPGAWGLRGARGVFRHAWILHGKFMWSRISW